MIVRRGSAAAVTVALGAVLLTASPAAAAVNQPPTISDVKVYERSACAPLSDPTPIAGAGSVYLSAEVSDPDTYSPRAVFAIWPVGHDDQRRTISGPVNGYSGPARAEFRPSGIAHDTVLAFQAQATDGTHETAWSAPCFLRVDAVAPAKGPVVSSADYPADGVKHGGVGVTGTFRFDVTGDPDVVTYQWRSRTDMGTVPAPSPGAPVTIDYAPASEPFEYLYVTALDAARNRSPEIRYDFLVRDLVPGVVLDVPGVGLPGTLRLSSRVSTVTSFGYRIGDAAEVRVPAVDAVAEIPVTITTKGEVTVRVRSFEDDDQLAETTETVTVTDAPRLTSEDFIRPGDDGMTGREGTFTLAPRSANVVAYRFTTGADDTREIPAAADGTAVVRWTPPAPGTVAVSVRSVTADGTVSDETRAGATVHDPRPTIYINELTYSPRIDGIGLPLVVEFGGSASGITAFGYRFNDGPEITVPAGDWVTVIPEHAGANTITARAHFSDGTVSAERELTFQVWNGPIVSSTDYPSGEEGGGPGVPGTFTFTPALPDVDHYTYSVDGDEQQTVDAAPDGTATAVYTPGYEGWKTMTVTSHSTDGTISGERQYNFTVAAAP